MINNIKKKYQYEPMLQKGLLLTLQKAFPSSTDPFLQSNLFVPAVDRIGFGEQKKELIQVRWAND